MELKSFEKEAQTRLKNAERREERQRRAIEITEAANNEHKNKNLIAMREQFLLYKLWDQFLKRKMESSTNKYTYLEEGFNRVKVIMNDF